MWTVWLAFFWERVVHQHGCRLSFWSGRVEPTLCYRCHPLSLGVWKSVFNGKNLNVRCQITGIYDLVVSSARSPGAHFLSTLATADIWAPNARRYKSCEKLSPVIYRHKRRSDILLSISLASRYYTSVKVP